MKKTLEIDEGIQKEVEDFIAKIQALGCEHFILVGQYSDPKCMFQIVRGAPLEMSSLLVNMINDGDNKSLKNAFMTKMIYDFSKRCADKEVENEQKH